MCIGVSFRGMSKKSELKFYTRDQVAEMFAIHARTVDAMIKRGHLKPIIRIGRRVLIPHGTVVKLAEEGCGNTTVSC